jgi:hypothetical protein
VVGVELRDYEAAEGRARRENLEAREGFLELQAGVVLRRVSPGDVHVEVDHEPIRAIFEERDGLRRRLLLPRPVGARAGRDAEEGERWRYAAPYFYVCFARRMST